MKLFLTIIIIALLNLFPSVSSLPVSGSQVPENTGDGSSSRKSVPQQVFTGEAKRKHPKNLIPRSQIEEWANKYRLKAYLEPSQLTDLKPGDVLEVAFIKNQININPPEGKIFRAAVFLEKIGDIRLFLPLFNPYENRGISAAREFEKVLPGLADELQGLSFTRDGRKYTRIGVDIRLWVSGIRSMTTRGKVVRDRIVFQRLVELVKEYGIRSRDFFILYQIFLPENQSPEAGTSSGSASAKPSQSLPESSSNAGHSRLRPGSNPSSSHSRPQKPTSARLRHIPYPTTGRTAPRSPLGHPSSGQPHHGGQGLVGGELAPAPGPSNEVTEAELRAMPQLDFLNSHFPPSGRAPYSIPYTHPHDSGQGPMDGVVTVPLTQVTEAELYEMSRLNFLNSHSGSNMGGMAPYPIPYTPHDSGQGPMDGAVTAPLTQKDLDDMWLASLSSNEHRW